MSSRNNLRVSDGINRLVRRLLVEIPGEGAAAADEREQNAIDFVREVLGRYSTPSLYISNHSLG
jgi:gamma-tubulin complex component 3